MTKNVLVVEDDIQLNIVISGFFKIKGYNVFNAYDGIEAVEKIDKLKKLEISLYVIDINLPSYNGIDIIKYIREGSSTTPIVIITASLEIENFTDAFNAGCNEYIKKPFHIKELEVRVDKLLKLSSNKIHFSENLYYDYESKYFYFKDEKIELRNKEKKLVNILIQNINKLVPLDVIYEYVWEDEDKDTYPIRQLLADLRKRIPEDIIKTVIKQGYIIEVKNEK